MTGTSPYEAYLCTHSTCRAYYLSTNIGSALQLGVRCCREWQLENSEFTEKLPTRAFLVPLDEDEELTVELSKGNSITIKYKAISELQPNGTR